MILFKGGSRRSRIVRMMLATVGLAGLLIHILARFLGFWPRLLEPAYLVGWVSVVVLNLVYWRVKKKESGGDIEPMKLGGPGR